MLINDDAISDSCLFICLVFILIRVYFSSNSLICWVVRVRVHVLVELGAFANCFIWKILIG